MATWGDLKNFTWGELKSFTWNDLSILNLNQLMYIKKVTISEKTQKQVNKLEERIRELEVQHCPSLPCQQTPKAKDSYFQKIIDLLNFACAIIQFFSLAGGNDSQERSDYVREISENVAAIVEHLQEDNQNVIGQSNCQIDETLNLNSSIE